MLLIEAKQYINFINERAIVATVLFLLYGTAIFVIYREFRAEGFVMMAAAIFIWNFNNKVKTLQKIEDGEKVNLPIPPPKWLRYSVYLIVVGAMLFFMLYG